MYKMMLGMDKSEWREAFFSHFQNITTGIQWSCTERDLTQTEQNMYLHDPVKFITARVSWWPVIE